MDWIQQLYNQILDMFEHLSGQALIDALTKLMDQMMAQQWVFGPLIVMCLILMIPVGLIGLNAKQHKSLHPPANATATQIVVEKPVNVSLGLTCYQACDPNAPACIKGLSCEKSVGANGET